jgi:hypothetical protein
MKNKSKFLLGLGAALILPSVSMTRAATMADVLFVVDESGSMSGEHAWLGTMVGQLETQLIAAGVTSNQYGLVGYGAGGGSHAVAGHQHTVGGGAFGTAAQLSTATGGLVVTGGTEDGWQAISYALSNYTFRSGAALNVILVTDEDRDDTSSDTYATTLAALVGKSALLNVVVDATYRNGQQQTSLGIDSLGNAYTADGLGGYTTTGGGFASSGFGTTIADYVNMALATGGAGWDLNQLRAGGLTSDSFTKAFTDIKVKEIVEQTPDGGTTLAMLGAVLAGLAGLRRKFGA